MAELSIQEALRLGVEAHRDGRLQEAEVYYTAIISAQPSHPDANHNMGVLAVGLSKVEQALPYFENAIASNPSVKQFWLSLIDALIKLEKFEEAQSTLLKAKDNGVDSKELSQFNKTLDPYLNKHPQEKISTETTKNTPLSEISHDTALKLANKRFRDGNFEEAEKSYKGILRRFPKSKKAKIGLRKIEEISGSS